MSERSDVTTLALLLGRLERLNEQLVSEICGAQGTTPAEMRVLALLRVGSGAGPTSPTQIARRIVQTSGGLTATLNRLERAGHITRLADPSDGRGKLVELTAGGRDFADRTIDAMADEYETVCSGLDVDQTLDSVRALIDTLARRNDEITTDGWSVPARHAGSVS